ncbi:protein translocase subunit SecD [Nibricoccus sp. IMCC34717]|uniref:protein translocase subunit SecD n=1 Tax=Nibricoccus sp. IMCC34717 TaxID=3034021 RepID=UPI00384E4533
MLKRNLWKIIVSIAVTAAALAMLLPISDRPFKAFAKTEAHSKEAEFAALINEADARVAAGQSSSTFVALKAIAKERKLDLATTYFPQFDLGDVKNVEKKNSILLDHLLKESKGKIQLGLDLKGGIAVTLEVDEKGIVNEEQKQVRHEKLQKAIDILSTRINSYGVTEPVIRPVGDNRIEIQLPSVNTRDNPEVVDLVKKPAKLDFRLVHPTLTPEMVRGDLPTGYEVMTLDYEGRGGEAQVEEVLVKKRPEMTGEALEQAFARHDEYGKAEIIMRFSKKGRERFADVTREIAQNNQRNGRLGRLAIVLDGKLYSAPTVREQINSDTAQITGSFTDREAQNLANALNNPLDLPLVVKSQYEVGPSLAADAISSGVKAATIGTVLVSAFMITYYTVGGVVAVISLAVNMLVLFGIMAGVGAVLTMPGLAGIVLTVGMAVDANILIFERMRDELNLGKSLKAALVSGYDKAFTTIVDAHITQVLICVIMIIYGTGPIRGFGVTLAIGVFSTLFSTLIVGHLLLEWLIEKDIIKKMPMLHLFKRVETDFVKWGKPAFIASWIVVALGVATVLYKGDKIYGIDFAGGDSTQLTFAKKLDLTEVRTIAAKAGVTEINPAYQTELGNNREVLNIETPFNTANKVVAALQAAHPDAKLESRGTTQIGPSIGAEIKWNAVISTVLSLGVILLYIAFRFEFGFAIGAVVSTLHDILMTIGVFVLAGYQFSAPMVAAILCIAGYSINDTVVVFDRIREDLRLNPTMNLRDIINDSIRRVFSRSVMTSVTSFLAALSLYLFGGGVIHELSFTFLVGIVTGTFSSIFIASPIFYWWHKGDRKHVEKHQDVKPTYEWTGSSNASE